MEKAILRKRMANMAETDNKQTGSVDNSLKMRNTETAALKRMPVSADSASASAAARKTIKLKPLVSSTGSSPGAPSSPSSSARVAPPSILLNRKPAAQPADQAPKFMSTNTAPIIKMAKPNAEKPVQTADLNAGAASAAADMTKTVSLWSMSDLGILDAVLKLTINKKPPDSDESRRFSLARPGGLEPLAFCSGVDVARLKL